MTESAETTVSEKEPARERKVREDDRLSKAELMGLIEELVTGSGIRKAKLWNPYDEIIGSGAKVLSPGDEAFKKTIKVTAGSDGPPDLIPDVEYSSVKAMQLRSWGLLKQESTGGVTMSEGDFEQEKARRRTAYVRWGRMRLPAFKAGNCSIFAAVTLGLASGKALEKLPAGIVIEQFNFVASDGHAFLVVNRSGGRKKSDGVLYDPTSWGPDAFVVDAWYANQKREDLDKPGSNAVKNVTGRDGDPYYDKKFLDWLSQFSFRAPTAFTYKFIASVSGS